MIIQYFKSSLSTVGAFPVDVFPFSLMFLTILSFYFTSNTAFFNPFSSNIFNALLKYL